MPIPFSQHMAVVSRSCPLIHPVGARCACVGAVWAGKMELERIRMHFDTAYQALTSSDEAGSSKAAASASPLSRVLKGLVRGHGPMTSPSIGSSEPYFI